MIIVVILHKKVCDVERLFNSSLSPRIESTIIEFERRTAAAAAEKL